MLVVLRFALGAVKQHGRWCVCVCWWSIDSKITRGPPFQARIEHVNFKQYYHSRLGRDGEGRDLAIVFTANYDTRNLGSNNIRDTAYTERYRSGDSVCSLRLGRLEHVFDHASLHYFHIEQTLAKLQSGLYVTKLLKSRLITLRELISVSFMRTVTPSARFIVG